MTSDDLRAENERLRDAVEYLRRVHSDAIASLTSTINSLRAVERQEAV